MIPEYYMVTGKLMDNGETVTGFYYERDNRIYIFPQNGYDSYDRYEIDPSTVERVAVHPVIKMLPSKMIQGQHECYCCQNCGIVFISNRSTQIYCCKQCRKAYINRKIKMKQIETRGNKGRLMKELFEISRKASSAGMSYGQYVLKMEYSGRVGEKVGKN